jgi:protease-4
VVLLISGLTAGLATIESLRNSVAHLRRSGKQAVAYLHNISLPAYYLAASCDQILAPESASFQATGLRAETIFLKDTLALAGIEADFEAIAEYKVTPDTYRRAEMSGPHRKMLESIVDSVYTEVVGAIAASRGMAPERVEELLDRVPLTSEQARDAGLLDAVCYEDELPAYLGSAGKPAALLAWDQAHRRLIYPRRWHNRRAIGVISVEGSIVTGSSRRWPVPFRLPIPLPMPSAQAGSNTLVQQLRAAAANKRLAAVILHVDSPGGSALASDLIWREVANLRRAKPTVVYMGNQAASGGYYVATPASAIVAQPATLTGSIGVWSGKIVTQGMFGKVRAGREVVSRGKAAGLFADTARFDEEERTRVRADIGEGYARFKARVARGRDMTGEEVEAIARGRVWTGRQAREHGLVDELGDLQAAVDKARELAGLDPRREPLVVDLRTPGSYQLAAPSPADADEWLSNLRGLLREGLFAQAPWEIRLLD